MKKKMNFHIKRAIMVLSTIAFLILIGGIGSCSMRLHQSDGHSVAADEPNHPSIAPDNETATLQKTGR